MCVSVCVHVCVRACVCACMRVCVLVCIVVHVYIHFIQKPISYICTVCTYDIQYIVCTYVCNIGLPIILLHYNITIIHQCYLYIL